MSQQHLSYLLVILSNFSFALASIFFTYYSKKLTPLWMNAFKTSATFIYLIVSVPLFIPLQLGSNNTSYGLMLSGAIGLGLGDLFLFRAFFEIGAARTLILFGFQPLFMAISSHFFFDQNIESNHAIAILLMMVCLFLFAFESKKETGNWQLIGLLYALIGVLLDTSGVVISRLSFDQSPELHPLWGHMFRTSGAVLFFILFSKFVKPIPVLTTFLSQSKKDRIVLLAAAFVGTYLSLYFYLSGIKIGHVASLTAITVTCPLFASLFEHLFAKKFPSKILILAFMVFLIGVWTLLGN